MASPDVVGKYIDLLLLDLDPQDIFELAIQNAKTHFPEWVPRETNMETVTYEGMAVQIAEAVFALNRVPSAVVTSLLRMQGIEFDEGEQPTATLHFEFNSSLGLTIPSGTSATLDLGTDLQPVVFTVLGETVVPSGSSSAYITAIGDRFTSEANGYPVGSILDLNDALIFVNSVTLGTVPTGGRDPETDEEYFERGAQLFSRMTSALVTADNFVAYALGDVNVEKAFAIDNYNASADPDNNGPYGNDGGHITVAVYGDGENVGSTDKAALEQHMEDMAVAMLDVHVIDPTLNTVNVTTSVVTDKGYADEDVKANVETALHQYLDTMNWDWSRTLRRNELIRVIGGATGVAYVNTLTVPAADVSLTGAAPLTTPGTLTVTAT